jgi:hypothetical protein
MYRWVANQSSISPLRCTSVLQQLTDGIYTELCELVATYNGCSPCLTDCQSQRDEEP